MLSIKAFLSFLIVTKNNNYKWTNIKQKIAAVGIIYAVNLTTTKTRNWKNILKNKT